MKECTEKQFLKDVSEHKMTILCDNGVHRCLKYAAEGERSWFNHFTLTTWPWHLAISGDMGTFVFNRLDDMFQFFRTAPDKEGLYINTGYWAEKCEAADRRTGGFDAYDADVFKSCVLDRFKEHEFESRADKRECLSQIKSYLLNAENEQEAHELASKFECCGFRLDDFWECRIRSYTFQYVWCCYAIAWGIRQYDNAKVEAVGA